MRKITIRISEEDFETINKAVKVSYDEKKHRKNYGYGAYMKESSLNRAKKLINKCGSKV